LAAAEPPNNNRCRIGDKIILTKPLGLSVATLQAIPHMTTLNHHTMKIAKNFNINAATDVTGFGFLGHLGEMLTSEYSIIADTKSIPRICPSDEIEKLMKDPQTSGGLLLSLGANDASLLTEELAKQGIQAAIVAEVVTKQKTNIIIT
jgi:selenide,water dikinase